MFNSATNSLFGVKVAGIGLGLAMLASPALADSISPTNFSDTIGVGESTTVNKTVTISAGSPTSAQADIFFLSDTTGSMGGVIGNVKTNASTILSNSAGFGNIQWGVGQYKDFGDVLVTQVQQTITNSQPGVQAAINTWVASGGGDTPEADLPALVNAANNGGWRAGSQKFIVWFGDAPGHEGGAYGTTASTIAALTAQNIKVIAVNSGNLDGTGQATAITSATGGVLTTVAGSGVGVSTVIQNALTAAFASYTNVSLDLSELPAGLAAGLVPTDYSAGYDRSVERVFPFDLTFTGLIPGDYTFNVYALLDGARFATEAEHIIVTSGEAGITPLPGTAALMLSGLAGLGALLRRRKQKKA
jgi:hypothetical protein